MKTLLTVLFCLSLPLIAADKPVHLFILSGQSNMQGMDPKTGFLPEANKLFEGDQIELYDLKNDLGEKEILAESMPEKTRELEAILTAWLIETKATIPKPVIEKNIHE